MSTLASSFPLSYAEAKLQCRRVHKIDRTEHLFCAYYYCRHAWSERAIQLKIQHQDSGLIAPACVLPDTPGFIWAYCQDCCTLYTSDPSLPEMETPLPATPPDLPRSPEYWDALKRRTCTEFLDCVFLLGATISCACGGDVWRSPLRTLPVHVEKDGLMWASCEKCGTLYKGRAAKPKDTSRGREASSNPPVCKTGGIAFAGANPAPGTTPHNTASWIISHINEIFKRGDHLGIRRLNSDRTVIYLEQGAIELSTEEFREALRG